VEAKSEVNDGSLLLLVTFLLVNAPNCHLSLVLPSVVQGDAVNCSTPHAGHEKNKFGMISEILNRQQNA